MIIEVADNILEQAGFSKSDLLLEIAISFYQRGKLSMGKASQLAGISRFVFQKELGKRGVAVNMDWEDVQRDMDTIQSLPKGV